MEKATSLYQNSLRLAGDYLLERGIDPAEAKRYRLGVVEEPYSETHEQYVGRLAIPYLTPTGVVSLRFRTLGNGTKYLSMPGDKGFLYNVSALVGGGDTIAVCEGELDALIVTEYAGVPAVGLPGVHLWKPAYDRCFAGFRHVLAVGDGDAAGESMIDALDEHLENLVPRQMPTGMDCNEFFLEEGPEALRDFLLKGLT